MPLWKPSQEPVRLARQEVGDRQAREGHVDQASRLIRLAGVLAAGHSLLALGSEQTTEQKIYWVRLVVE